MTPLSLICGRGNMLRFSLSAAVIPAVHPGRVNLLPANAGNGPSGSLSFFARVWKANRKQWMVDPVWQTDSRRLSRAFAEVTGPSPLPKCPFIAAFVTFAVCLPTVCLIVWLVWRGFTS